MFPLRVCCALCHRPSACSAPGDPVPACLPKGHVATALPNHRAEALAIPSGAGA